MRAEWSGPAKDTPQSIPAGLIRAIGYKAEKKSSPVSRQRASEALTCEPADTIPDLVNDTYRTTEITATGETALALLPPASDCPDGRTLYGLP